MLFFIILRCLLMNLQLAEKIEKLVLSKDFVH